MAIDLTLGTVASGYNLSTINSNFSTIQSALQDALSLSGNTPNTMSADLDLNGQQILNLGVPTESTHAVRYMDIEDVISSADDAAAAAVSAAAALVSETNAAESETNVFSSERSVGWCFETSTTMSQPGDTCFRLNNATLSSVTSMAVHKDDWNSIDVSDFVATWGASTNTNKGYIQLRNQGDTSFFALYTITSAVTDNTDWLQFTVSHVASSGSLGASDIVFAHQARSGDQGASGGGSGDMVAANNLSDVASASTSRTNLGLGALATLGSVAAAQLNTDAVETLKVKDLNITTSKIALNAIGLEQMAGGTDGNLITYDASGDPAYVATGTADQVLTSNGAGAAPTFQDAASSAPLPTIQTLTVDGSYTPTSGMVYACVEVQGAGGDGGPAGTSTNTPRGGGGGGAGGYSKKWYTAAELAAGPYSYTVGVTAGEDSTFEGQTGSGGNDGTIGTTNGGSGGTGGTGTGGDVNISGGKGHGGSGGPGSGGGGGNAVLGHGGSGGRSGAATGGPGGNATVYGGGGGGGGGGSATAGTAGDFAAGVIIITEYIG